MTVRAVLAVVLAGVLIGAATPVIEDARRSATAATVTEQVQTLERAAQSLVATDDPVDGRGARRIVTVTLPDRDRTGAGVEQLELLVLPDGSTEIVWETPTGTRERIPVDGPPLRPADGERLTLQSDHHRLVLALRGGPGEPVVTVRKFKS